MSQNNEIDKNKDKIKSIEKLEMALWAWGYKFDFINFFMVLVGIVFLSDWSRSGDWNGEENTDNDTELSHIIDNLRNSLHAVSCM